MFNNVDLQFSGPILQFLLWEDSKLFQFSETVSTNSLETGKEVVDTELLSVGERVIEMKDDQSQIWKDTPLPTLQSSFIFGISLDRNVVFVQIIL